MNRMKGMELPINMIIIIAIAVLVFVVVAAYFAGAFGGSKDKLAAQAAWNTFCGSERVTGCHNYDNMWPNGLLDVDGTQTSLSTVCTKAKGISGDACRTDCCGRTTP